MNVRIPDRAFNRAYRPLLRDREHRYLVLYGGAGSGKSVFAAQRYLVRLMESPLCNLLAARATAVSHRDSTYALLKQVIARWNLGSLFKCADSGLRVTCKNGNAVILKGLDDPEKIKSVTFPKGELTDIWVEEASERTLAQFNQLDLRLRGRGAHKQITLTFNPISAQHWLKQRFFDHPDPRARVLKTTYRDNAFLDGDYRRTLESYRDSDPYFYQVYCLGEWGVMGRSIFDAAQLSRRLGELAGPRRRGEFVFSTVYQADAGQVLIHRPSIRFADQPEGFLSVYEEPQPGREYVIGGDTAGEGSDYFAAQVLDRESGRQACTLRGRMDEDLYARQLYCLGLWYNQALVAVEANFSSYPIRELERLGYPRQYARPREDGLTHRPGVSLGFRTTAATRPVILAGLVEEVRERCQGLRDRDTIEELLAFVRNEKGRPEAQAGAHDDCVMALAIAHYLRRSAPKPALWSCSIARGGW